jgi:hypothetical protein
MDEDAAEHPVDLPEVESEPPLAPRQVIDLALAAAAGPAPSAGHTMTTWRFVAQYALPVPLILLLLLNLPLPR